jgi:hypothetical protein
MTEGLVMETETVSEMYKNYSILTLLIVQADFTAINCCESLRVLTGNHCSLPVTVAERSMA